LKLNIFIILVNQINKLWQISHQIFQSAYTLLEDVLSLQFKILLNINAKGICSTSGLPKNSEFTSIHAEHKALEHYIINERPRPGKKITLIVWRNYGENNDLGCAKPCGLCVMRTLPRLCKILKISHSLLEIYYSIPEGFIKTNLKELSNTHQFISTGSRLRLRN